MPPTAKHGRALPVRVSERGYERLAKRAAEEAGGNISEIVRRMLKYASVNMPKGYR